MGDKRGVGLCLLVILALLLPAPSGVAGLGRAPVSLGRGEAVFLHGPRIDTASGTSCNSDNCRTYTFRVSSGGWRLRVGIDHPDHHDEFKIELFDPDGRTAGTRSHRFLETPELLIPGPMAGTWKLNVIATDVRSTSYLVRAKLETGPPAIRSHVEILPNLRPEPGFDFMFTTPVGSNYGVSGPASISCHPDEVVEDQVVRCLRFAFGYHNAGDGPLDLRFRPLADPTTLRAQVSQRIYRGDATVYDYDDNDYRDRSAGTASYHEVHGHYHYDAVIQAEVLRVEDLQSRKLSPLGEAEKRGACAHDWVLVDFHRFYQDPAGTADSGADCSFTYTDPTSSQMRIGLSRGWADIYTAELSDNYANFGLNGDGLYLVRVATDPDDLIRETNERDNYAYSLIEVAGEEITVLERGRGMGPWDERKVIQHGLG